MRTRLVLVPLVLLAVVGGGLLLRGHHHAATTPATAEASKGKHGKPPIPVAFDLVRLSREGVGVIGGTAEPGQFVDVVTDGNSIGKSRASDSGSWEVVVGAAFSPGTHIVRLVATDAAGGETRSFAEAVIGVPPPGPPVKKPKVENKADKPPPPPEEGVLAVLMPPPGHGAIRVLQRPGQVKPKIALGLDTAEFDTSGQTLFAGRAGVDEDVSLFLDGQPVGTTKSDDEGNWTLTVDRVTPAPHTVRLDEADAGDGSPLSMEQPFDPSTTLKLPVDTAPALVKPADTVWHVIRRDPSGAVRYAQVFRADQGELRNIQIGKDNSKAPGTLKPGAAAF